MMQRVESLPQNNCWGSKSGDCDLGKANSAGDTLWYTTDTETKPQENEVRRLKRAALSFLVPAAGRMNHKSKMVSYLQTSFVFHSCWQRRRDICGWKRRCKQAGRARGLDTPPSPVVMIVVDPSVAVSTPATIIHS